LPVTEDRDSPDRGSRELTLGLLRTPAEHQPGGRDPAPGELGLVQAFANTFWDLDRHRPERFGDASALAKWLADHHLLDRGARLGPADLRRALDVREGLRALLFVNNGAMNDRPAVERLNRALRGRGLFVQLDPWRKPDFKAHGRDLDAALASIATIVAVAQLDGRWSHLKACRGVHCGWTFYDHSRNQAGSWCAMSVCGSRAKARDYRRRKRDAEVDEVGRIR
jgi:predicted RNA-binding Zn ribbon-like protein